jgi:hypothetical protein
MKLNSNTTLIIVAALVVAGGAYWFFFTGTGNQTPLAASQGQSAAQAQFQSLVGELAPIKFDTSLFADPRFESLVDLATPVAPEPLGRSDPFAPIPGVPSGS